MEYQTDDGYSYFKSTVTFDCPRHPGQSVTLPIRCIRCPDGAVLTAPDRDCPLSGNESVCPGCHPVRQVIRPAPDKSTPD